MHIITAVFYAPGRFLHPLRISILACSFRYRNLFLIQDELFLWRWLYFRRRRKLVDRLPTGLILMDILQVSYGRGRQFLLLAGRELRE